MLYSDLYRMCRKIFMFQLFMFNIHAEWCKLILVYSLNALVHFMFIVLVIH